MSQIIATDAFKVIEGRPVTSSRIVAEYFGKKHSDVVRAVVNTIAAKPELEASRNFAQWSEDVEIGSGAKRTVVGYWMDRKGFSILAMGFTGAKALDFKCAFYDQFERMEEALRAPTDQSAQISTSEQYEIRKAIKARAKNSSVHYQTVYNALYDYFKIASYKDLRHDQMKAALTLIETCSLKPQLPAPKIPEGSIVIDEAMAKRIVGFIYYWRYLFRDDLNLFLALLRRVQSPLAPHFWEAVNDLGLGFMEEALAKQGYSVKDLACYQHWASHQPKRLTA